MCISAAWGQTFKSGLNPPSRESIDRSPKLNFRGTGRQLPVRFDLKKVMPPVGDQGAQGSCAAWASGYAFASYYFGVEKAWPLTKGTTYDEDHVMSPAFVYGHRPNPKSSGMGLDDAFSIMSRFGNIPISKLKYDDKVDRRLPDSAFQPEAKAFKLGPYRVLYGWKSDTIPGRETIREKDLVEKLKAAIYDGTPVVTGVCANLKLQLLGRNLRKTIKPEAVDKLANIVGTYDVPIVWNERNTDICGQMEGLENRLLPDDDLKKIGGHAIIIVGWDDSMGGDGAFLIQNSWGEKWGDHGFGWIDYQSLKEVMMIAVSSVDIPQPGAVPRSRPDFIDVPGVDENLWASGVKAIKSGMRMNDVFKILGGPTNAESIRFMQGGVSVMPVDTNDAAGVHPWIYESDSNGMLVNVIWKDGRVSEVLVRSVKKTEPFSTTKVEAHHSEIHKGMTFDEVSELIGGPNNLSVQFLENGKMANGDLTYDGPDNQYQVVLSFEGGIVIRKKIWFNATLPKENAALVDQNYDDVGVGMKPAKVHELLGGPVGASFKSLFFFAVDEKQRPRDGWWRYSGTNSTVVRIKWDLGVVGQILAYTTTDADAPAADPAKVKANRKQLREGMTKAEVYNLLGGARERLLDPKTKIPLDFIQTEIGNTGWEFAISDSKDILELRWKNGRLADWEVFKVKK